MPDVSSDQGLTLPNATDNANGPLAFDNYNDDVENRLVKRYTSTADRTVRNPAPNQGELSYVQNLDDYQRYNTAWKSVRAVDKTVRAIVRRSTTFGLATATVDFVEFDSAVLNDYSTSMWNIASPDTVLLPEAGLYWVTMFTTFSANSTGIREVGIGTSGGLTTGVPAQIQVAAASPELSYVHMSAFVYTTTGAGTIRMYVRQTSGTTLTIGNIDTIMMVGRQG